MYNYFYIKQIIIIILVVAFSVCQDTLLVEGYNDDMIEFNSLTDDSLDHEFWQFGKLDDSPAYISNISVDFETNNTVESIGAAAINYSTNKIASWGGFVALRQWFETPQDWSDGSDFTVDYVSFWIYIENPASLPAGSLRFNLHDVSSGSIDIDESPDIAQVEYYYSFLPNDLLYREPGWNQILIPLQGVYTTNMVVPYTDGFVNPGWNGIQGNAVLDLDAIQGYSLEFMYEGQEIVNTMVGTIIIDQLEIIHIPQLGCTDQSACNYDPEANTDDGSCYYDCVDITFVLDMQQESHLENQPYIVGYEMTGISGVPMVEIEQDLWEVTLSLRPGNHYYRFRNGGTDNWWISDCSGFYSLPCWEVDLDQGCAEEIQTQGNQYMSRVVTVEDIPQILEHTFSNCYSCIDAEPVNVTFQVNTNDIVEINPQQYGSYNPNNDMYMIGTYQNASGQPNFFDPTTMHDDGTNGDLVAGDGIWSVTLTLDGGQHVEYFFMNGAYPNYVLEWDEEIDACGLAPEACASEYETQGSNPRWLDVSCIDGEISQVLEPVTFKGCNTTTTKVTFELQLGDLESDPGGVFIGGGSKFGAPGENGLELKDDGESCGDHTADDGIYSIAILAENFGIEPGNSYEYAFYNGNCPLFSCKEDLFGQSCTIGQWNDRELIGPSESVILQRCYGDCIDGFCDQIVYGCTDPSASNYDNQAMTDDNSCNYGNDQLLYSPGFEADLTGWLRANATGENWENISFIPENINITNTGDELFGTSETFNAYEGQISLKLYGNFAANAPNITTVYQELITDAGTPYSFTAMLNTLSSDSLAGGNIVYLQLKYFDSNYNYLGSSQSLDTLSSSSQKDTWSMFNVDGLAVNGTEIIQACIVFEQGTQGNSSIYDDGAVFIDDVALYNCENSDCQQLEINQGTLLNKYSITSIYPNPFNPLTTIKYEIPNLSHVSLKIYDLSGREIDQLVNKELEEGYHVIEWNASNFPSGVYFVKMISENFFQTQKIMLIK